MTSETAWGVPGHISVATERPPGATGVQWWIPQYRECFAVIDEGHAATGLYRRAAPGEFLFDHTMTGSDNCTCDTHGHARAARRRLC